MNHIKELSRKIENAPSEALCLCSDIKYKLKKLIDDGYIILIDDGRDDVIDSYYDLNKYKNLKNN